MSRVAGKKLAVLGASYLQKPLVTRANALGVHTICFAWEDGAVCRDICSKYFPISIVDKEAVLKAAETEGIEGIVTAASDVGVPTVSYVAEKMGLVANTVDSARRATNKVTMRETLAAAGLPCPAFVRIDSDANTDAAENLRFPVIVKPVDRSGSAGVTRVDTPSALLAAVRAALDASLTGEAIIEEFVEGSEVSVETISWEGEHYHLAITDKTTTGPPHFVELAHHQPSLLPPHIQLNIQRFTARSLDALGIRYGASHAEFLIRPSGDLVVTEVAARLGGDFIGDELVRLFTGYDFTQGVIEAALGQFVPPQFSSTRKCSGILFASPQTAEVMSLIENAAHYPECVRAEKLSELGAEVRRSADRNGYLIYQSHARFHFRQIAAQQLNTKNAAVFQ